MYTILKKVLVVFMLIFSTILSMSVAFGQRNASYLDTIRLQIPNGVTIEYAMNYHRNKIRKYHHNKLEKHQKEFKRNIKDFLKRWEVLGITNLEEKKPLIIKDLMTQIEITERENNRTVFFPRNTKLALTVKGKHKLNIPQSYSDLHIYFDNINQLEELLHYDIEKILQKGDEKLVSEAKDRKNKRKLLKAWLSVDKNNEVGLTYNEFVHKEEKYKDYFCLGISPSIQNINGNWLSGVSLDIGLVLNAKYRFGISYEAMYNFSEDNKANRAEWIDLSTELKTNFLENDWWGISMGYLINHRGGDFFDNHKFRIGLPITTSRSFTVTPEFYFKDFFKESKEENEYFGVKISFNL